MKNDFIKNNEKWISVLNAFEKSNMDENLILLNLKSLYSLIFLCIVFFLGANGKKDKKDDDSIEKMETSDKA